MTTSATVQLEHRVAPLDPRNRSTWKNIPSPVDLAPINAALRDAGGVNEFGEANFIIVWAQEYKTWDAGGMRIHFDDENIEAIHTPRRFACRPDVFTRATAWLEKGNARRAEAYMRLDFDGVGHYPNVADYLKTRELANDYYELPSDETDMGRLARLMPDGWMYIHGHWDFEHIGQQAFYVLQYFRPQEFGGRKEWDELRFGEQYCPETDRVEPLVDILGPFPERGQYENVVLRVADLDTYEDPHPVEIGTTITRDILRFKAPTVAYVCDRVREMIKLRDSLTHAQKDSRKRSAKRFKDFHDRLPEMAEKYGDEFSARFRAAKPVGGGNPTNISTNKTKFDN